MVGDLGDRLRTSVAELAGWVRDCGSAPRRRRRLARAFYNRQRSRGATHYQALRALANRLVGILHGCLRSHTLYDEHHAWHTEPDKLSSAA